MPELASSDWGRIEDLFHAALEQPSAERARWLAEQTRGDTGIRNEVQSLLAAQQKHEALSRAESTLERTSGLGERFLGEFCGAYRLERLIGQGGMAWVYEAVRVTGDFRQRVAVKVLPAVFGEALNERFRQEKQILAELSHTGIARLLDGGVNQSGLSYLVMEYVEGERITSYAASHQLNRQDRIRLFIKICEAVEFAHSQRVIHRDIKPANILVATGGQPKLLDFGIARLMDQDGTGQATLWRAHTPGYASPEQLCGSPAGVWTDVYQLGVLLAELLTGRSPKADQPATSQEVDTELRKSLGADLSAVIAKARREQADERYPSVALLAEDLNRYLEGLPVRANRGAPIIRAGKLAKRYRLRLALAALLLLVLASGAALLYEARSRSQERIRRANEMYQLILQEGTTIEQHITGNRPEPAFELWRRLSDSVEQVRLDDPDNPGLHEILGQCYLRLGQLAWFRYLPSLMDPEAALPNYERARELFDKAGRIHSLGTGAMARSLSARMFGSEVLIEKGHGLDAFAEVTKLLQDGETRQKEDVRTSTVTFHADLASYYDMLCDRLGGHASWASTKWEGAPPRYAKLADLRPCRATDSIAVVLYREELAGPPEPNPSPLVTRAMVRMRLGTLQHQAGLRAQGVRTLQDSLSDLTTLLESPTPNHFALADVHSQLGNAAEVEGNYTEALRERAQAIQILEEQFGRNQEDLYVKERLGEARIAIARVLARLGRHAEALATGRLGIQLLDENARRNRAPAVTLDLAAQRLLTMEPAELRDGAKALDYARKAVDQTAGQMPPYLVTLAFAQDDAGLHEEARQSATQAIRGYQTVFAILQPLFDSPRYPEANRLARELRAQLEQVVW